MESTFELLQKKRYRRLVRFPWYAFGAGTPSTFYLCGTGFSISTQDTREDTFVTRYCTRRNSTTARMLPLLMGRTLGGGTGVAGSDYFSDVTALKVFLRVTV